MSELRSLSTGAKRTLILANTYINALESHSVPAYYDEMHSSHARVHMARGAACYNNYRDLGYTNADIRTMYKLAGVA